MQVLGRGEVQVGAGWQACLRRCCELPAMAAHAPNMHPSLHAACLTVALWRCALDRLVNIKQTMAVFTVHTGGVPDPMGGCLLPQGHCMEGHCPAEGGETVINWLSAGYMSATLLKLIQIMALGDV